MRPFKRPGPLSCLFLLVLSSSLSAAASSLQLYGSATAGSGGLAPRVWAQDTAWPGNPAFGVTIDSAVGGGAAFLLIGAQPLDAYGSGFTWNVLPFFISPPLPLSGAPGAPGAGGLAITLPIPAMPQLLGFSAYFQWVVTDPGAASGYAASEGLEVIITDPPLVIAVGSDPTMSEVFAINPLSGTISNWSLWPSNVDVALSPDGSLAVMSTAIPRTFVVADAASGASLGSVTVAGVPNCAVFTPDGTRCYGLVGSDAANNFQEIIEIDLDPLSPTFAQKLANVTGFPAALKQWEGGGISADGRILTAANLGLGNPAAIVIIDIDPLSPAKNTVIGYVPVTDGGYPTDVEPNRDGSLAFASVAYLADHGDMKVIDVAAGTIVAHVPVGLFPTDIDLDGRGDYAFLACPNSNEVTRVGVNPYRPGYLTPTAAPGFYSPFAVGLSPEGDKVYVCQMMSSTIKEMNAQTLSVTNSWNLPASPSEGVAAR